MKKLLIAGVLLGVYLHWSDITGFFGGSSALPPADEGVVLYATEWCGYCEKTRELFAEHNVSYVERDIEKSSQAHKEYRQLGGRGVPVINAHGDVVHGYSRQRILAAVQPK